MLVRDEYPWMLLREDERRRARARRRLLAWVRDAAVVLVILGLGFTALTLTGFSPVGWFAS